MRVDKSNAEDLSKQRPSSKFATALHFLLKYCNSNPSAQCLVPVRAEVVLQVLAKDISTACRSPNCFLSWLALPNTQEKPFPTQSIPRHFEAIVLPIVGLYCWGGLPYASGQVLFAVQDYSVASVLALFDSVWFFFQRTGHMFNHVHNTFHLDLTLDFPRCFGDFSQEWYGPGTSHGRWILSATFGVARLKVSWYSWICWIDVFNWNILKHIPP